MPNSRGNGKNLAASNEGLTPSLKGSLDDELAGLRNKIAARALELAQERSLLSTGTSPPEDAPLEISLQDLNQAMEEEVGKRPVPPRKTSFFDLFPPFTCICCFLCLVFGWLGLYGEKGGDKQAIQGFLDVSKIFAGALVGSTASIAMKSPRSRGGRS
jgi:hypothetical protein